MKPTLFIDFDGSLCHDRYWRSLPIDIFEQLQAFLFKENTNLFVDWMKGVYTSEYINQILSEKLSINKNDIWELFVSDCKEMNVSQATLDRIKALQKLYHTVLVTDNMDCFDRFIKPVLRLDYYFDTIVNSYNEKSLKSENEGSIFRKYVVGDIKDAILIDNSKKICDVFSSLGGIAFHIIEDVDIDIHLNRL